MAKLPSNILDEIFELLKKLSELVDDATFTEYLIFEKFGQIRPLAEIKYKLKLIMVT